MLCDTGKYTPVVHPIFFHIGPALLKSSSNERDNAEMTGGQGPLGSFSRGV